MSELTRAGVKTRAVSLPDELHAQITLVAKLDGTSWQDAVRQAVEEYVQRKRSQGDLAARAAEALAEIEQEAALRRDALTALFGPGALLPPAAVPAGDDVPPTLAVVPTPDPDPATPPRRRGPSAKG